MFDRDPEFTHPHLPLLLETIYPTHFINHAATVFFYHILPHSTTFYDRYTRTPSHIRTSTFQKTYSV